MGYLTHFMSSIFRASKSISGQVKVTVTSPAELVKFFLNVEPCYVIIRLLNPYNVEATFVHGRKMQKVLKTI